MNCAEVKELLSAYYDAEASADDRVEIDDHLRDCPECSAELAGFAQLSGVVQHLDTPGPPQHGWQRLHEQLDGEPASDAAERVTTVDRTVGPSRLGYRVSRPVLAIAALLLIVLGSFAFHTWFHPGDHKLLAADFEQYVDEFQRDPAAAQRMLVSKYKGQTVELGDVVPRISYRPAAADGLPSGYTLDAMYLLRMPCCNCLQTVCQRSDGSKIAIWEYGEEQPLSVGGRAEKMSQCRGKNCCMVEISDKFAASWKRGTRHIALVGVRDQAEMDYLVRSLD